MTTQQFDLLLTLTLFVITALVVLVPKKHRAVFFEAFKRKKGS